MMGVLIPQETALSDPPIRERLALRASIRERFASASTLMDVKEPSREPFGAVCTLLFVWRFEL